MVCSAIGRAGCRVARQRLRLGRRTNTHSHAPTRADACAGRHRGGNRTSRPCGHRYGPAGSYANQGTSAVADGCAAV